MEQSITETKMQRITFPKNFLWGAAGSAYQTEGDNKNTDWWVWEHSQRRIESLLKQGKNPEDFYSGIACDSYHRYEEDFALAKHLGHNATRFSIEWARIEPSEGQFDETELAHYEKVLQAAKYHNLTTFVTMHHYTNPVWFAKKGGFARKENLKYFVRYAEALAKRFSEYADIWITINEPEVYSTLSYFLGIYPPQQKNLFHTWEVLNNLVSAHNQAYEKIKLHGNKPVGMANQLPDLLPASILSGPVVVAAKFFNEYLLRKASRHIDFIGLNYYFHHHVGWLGHRSHSKSGHVLTDVGWPIHAEGIERSLLNLKKFGKPIYVTENGLADAKDDKREKFIKDHLYYVNRAIQGGADVRGYLYWSLLDNFEWDKGFGPRFGLVEIDRNDLLRRKVRYSAAKFAEICRNNYMDY